MKSAAVALSTVAVLATACGAPAAVHAGRPRPATQPRAIAPVRLAAVSADSTATRCTLGDLAVRLGPAGHAAGSTYRPIVFTNTSGSACTLTGYPGVSYVAPKSGRQVGAAAARDRAMRTRTVRLAPGGHAAALLQLVDYLNYPAANCAAKTVSGLRVYPPGSRTAAYVPFAHKRKACSSQVPQLSVRTVVRGRSGT